MSFLKYLICSILVTGSVVGQEGEGGWFPVEHSQAAPADGEEVDPSIWVLFSKRLGEEKLSVRFPKDPSYELSLFGDFAVSAEKEGETFSLKTLKGGIEKRLEEIKTEGDLLALDRKSNRQVDVLYRLKGKWIQERLLETPHSLYSLQTMSSEPDSASHLLFADSLRIE